ncbi:hypothetical protein CLDAP_14610 [Caldilinea aerophila DSM 14535 = NBRC 104270]|uniref:Uncharacterized protein n=1 Tax=Caldilinea aerophila (strain DSM 14535 / JCM 11387 / NBRC 104270 / STL-6-O1) TaxID=926550 RepID=I0I2L3_CALAS|nr:hypothetical protein CLDAP_14610 [Caldilinea aerophila DSM 14535 = NBRC 104270]
MTQDSLSIREGAKAFSQPSAGKANTGKGQPIAWPHPRRQRKEHGKGPTDPCAAIPTPLQR